MGSNDVGPGEPEHATMASCRLAAEADLAQAANVVLGLAPRPEMGDGDAPFRDDVLALLAERGRRDPAFGEALWRVVDRRVAEVHLAVRTATWDEDADPDGDAARLLDGVACERLLEALALAADGGPDAAVRFECGGPLDGLDPSDATPAGVLLDRVAIPGACVVATPFGPRRDLRDPTWRAVWALVVADYEALLEADPESPNRFHHFFEGIEPVCAVHHVVMGS